MTEIINMKKYLFFKYKNKILRRIFLNSSWFFKIKMIAKNLSESSFSKFKIESMIKLASIVNINRLNNIRINQLYTERSKYIIITDYIKGVKVKLTINNSKMISILYYPDINVTTCFNYEVNEDMLGDSNLYQQLKIDIEILISNIYYILLKEYYLRGDKI